MCISLLFFVYYKPFIPPTGIQYVRRPCRFFILQREPSPVITYCSRKLRRKCDAPYTYRGEIGHTQRPIYWVRRAEHAQTSKSDELHKRNRNNGKWKMEDGETLKWRNVHRYKQRKTRKMDAQEKSTRI